MKHSEQVRLLESCLKHIDEKTTQHFDEEYFSPVYKYHDQEWFDREMDAVFRSKPSYVAHISELANENDFITYDLFGTPIIVSHVAPGEYKAFVNVCRHRGAMLEEKESGSKKRFMCPYHGWTYGCDGKLKGVPFSDGFPTLKKEDNSLRELPLWERDGFIFVSATGSKDFDFDKFWAPIADDIKAMNTADMQVYRPVSKDWKTNWKLVTGGGLESYHFKVTHNKTIAPYFFNNVSICERLESHFRLVLPRQSILDLKGTDQSEWRLRDHSHVVYNVFPNMSLLVQDDHIAMFTMKPKGPELVEITFKMLIPNELIETEDQAHWKRNHMITETTLAEDFSMGEMIQRGIKSNANEHLRFGLFEGALGQLEDLVNESIENYETVQKIRIPQ